MKAKRLILTVSLVSTIFVFNSTGNALTPTEYKSLDNKEFTPLIVENRPKQPISSKTAEITPIYDTFAQKRHVKPLIPDIKQKLAILAPKKPKITVNGTKSAKSAKLYALNRIGATQFACLDKLFTRESHWRWNALNHSSGAYGIPQALPGRKMAKAGADWRTNPVTQVKWGLSYIKSRYGTACGAWNHSQRTGWY